MENIFENISGMWHENERTVRVHADRVSVKIYSPSGEFQRSCMIPSLEYPLSGPPEIFSYKNTLPLDTERYSAVREAFNASKYKPGHCYQNTERLIQEMHSRGVEVTPYVGWLFIGDDMLPAHHCWAMATLDGEKYVLDLTDDYTVLTIINRDNLKQVDGKEEMRELLVDFTRQTAKQPNTVRCFPVGTPTPYFFYVGCPCEPDAGRKIYRDLIKKFPDHDNTINVDQHGMTPMLRRLYKEGLVNREE